MNQKAELPTRQSSSKVSFKRVVHKIVSEIPAGKVMTYGQIAALAGNPRSARQVGQIAHFGDVTLPWHRVVNVKGVLASGYVPGGRGYQAELLRQENIIIEEDFKIKNLQDYLWRPLK